MERLILVILLPFPKRLHRSQKRLNALSCDLGHLHNPALRALRGAWLCPATSCDVETHTGWCWVLIPALPLLLSSLRPAARPPAFPVLRFSGVTVVNAVSLFPSSECSTHVPSAPEGKHRLGVRFRVSLKSAAYQLFILFILQELKINFLEF